MAATNSNLLRYDGTMGVNTRGERVPMATADSWVTQEADRHRRYLESSAAQRRGLKIAGLGAAGMVAGPLAFSALGGGATLPAAATEGIEFSSAAGGGMAGVPWLKLAEIGVGTGMDLWGQRNAGKANDRALALEMASQDYYRKVMEKQMALDEQRFNADEEQRRVDRVASEDERAYTRSLSEGRERRRGPYRAVGQAALMSLADIAHLRPRY